MLRNFNFGVRIEEMIIDNYKYFVIRELVRPVTPYLAFNMPALIHNAVAV